jgi:tetrahydromethanopterin S-methyltransferase subunit C
LKLENCLKNKVSRGFLAILFGMAGAGRVDPHLACLGAPP